MSGSDAVFLAVGAIGFGVLLLSLLLGDLFGHDTEFGHDLEHPGEIHAGEIHAGELPGDLHSPSPLSTRVIAASFVGFGAFGWVASSIGLPAVLSWPIAAAGLFVVGAGSFFLILKPLARQQFNSLMSRYNFVGQLAVVTLDIEPGGTGRVTFTDRQGARVNQTARSDAGEAVAKGVTVQIVGLEPGGVVVHLNRFSL